MAAPMGSKRGQGRGSFVTSVLDLVEGFYSSTVQGLKGWTAPAPRLRTPEPGDVESAVPEALVSTALSSQDRAEGDEGGAEPRNAASENMGQRDDFS
jgi:hypothetical protein